MEKVLSLTSLILGFGKRFSGALNILAIIISQQAQNAGYPVDQVMVLQWLNGILIFVGSIDAIVRNKEKR